jgi:hypothetical protein
VGERKKREAMTITRAGVWGVTASVWGNQCQSVADGSAGVSLIKNPSIKTNPNIYTLERFSRFFFFFFPFSRFVSKTMNGCSELKILFVFSFPSELLAFNILHLKKEKESRYYLRGVQDLKSPQIDLIPAAVNRQWRPRPRQREKKNKQVPEIRGELMGEEKQDGDPKESTGLERRTKLCSRLQEL